MGNVPFFERHAFLLCLPRAIILGVSRIRFIVCNSAFHADFRRCVQCDLGYFNDDRGLRFVPFRLRSPFLPSEVAVVHFVGSSWFLRYFSYLRGVRLVPVRFRTELALIFRGVPRFDIYFSSHRTGVLGSHFHRSSLGPFFPVR